MKIKTLLTGLVVAFGFTTAAQACGEPTKTVEWTKEFVFTASHPSLRCMWTWGDDMTRYEEDLSPDYDSFEEAEQALQPYLKKHEDNEYLKTKDRNNNGIVDWFSVYIDGKPTLFAVGSESLKMLYGDMNSEI